MKRTRIGRRTHLRKLTDEQIAKRTGEVRMVHVDVPQAGRP
jgi:hypothetical protein